MAVWEAGGTPTAETSLLQAHGLDRLAVFRALRLGDMLCAVPALRALRSAAPDTEITLVGLPWAEQFARRFARYVDRFMAFPGHPALPEQRTGRDQAEAFEHRMRALRFDLALQLHGNGQVSNDVVGGFGARRVAGFVPADAAGSGLALSLPYPECLPEPLRLLALTARLGAPSASSALEFPVTEDDECELAASGVARDLAPGGYICIHPGASTPEKCWPAERFAQVGDRLAREHGLPVVLTGSRQDAAFTRAVASGMQTPTRDAAGPLSIGAMAALLRGARLLICNDTGVSHIAAGLRLPSVVIFNQADMRRWAPMDTRLHRCIRDPGGKGARLVLSQARNLLGRGREAPASV